MPFPRRDLVCLLALCAACSEARYADSDPDAAQAPPEQAAVANDAQPPTLDAGSTATPSPRDAGAPALSEDATTGAWQDALASTYAIVMRFHSKDRNLASQALFSHQIVLLAIVSTEDGKVFLDAKRCEDRGNAIGLGLRGEFWWPHAQAVRPTRYELVMRPDGLRTEAPPRELGFRGEQPAGCAPGQKLAVDGRPWLADGKCDCRAEPRPVVPRDCRIVDDDGDKLPGVTVNHRGVFNDVEPMRTLDSSQITNGQLGAGGRIDAFYIENYDGQPMNCGDEPCVRPEMVSCPLMLNPVAFEPLAEGKAWDCDQVLEEANAGRLFSLPMLTFPNSGC